MSEYIVEVTGQMPDAIYERELTEIVRCRDCKNYDQNDEPSEVYPDRYWCDKLTVYMPTDGFCSRGEKASNFTTCKCGEEIELGNRESAVCPSCGRTVIE